MAKRTAKTAESEFPHPRVTTALLGQDAVLAKAARAIRSGKPPQGWLISGPPGVGKATLAYRIARYLLAYGATADGPADLAVPANDPAALQVAAGSHPGLLLLQRVINEKTGKLFTGAQGRGNPPIGRILRHDLRGRGLARRHCRYRRRDE